MDYIVAIPPFMIGITVFLFGLIIGSFLNVCIYRIPKSISLITPRSTCPNCSQPICWYDNIPIVSYMILGGRCRYCGYTISIRYPAVELISGILAWGIFVRYGINWSGLILYVFSSALLVITFIDIDYRIIPDTITLPGIVIGFLASFKPGDVSWQESLFGILFGGGSLLAVALIYKAFTKKDGMGGGDIKLLAMIGSFLGWRAVAFTIFVSSVLGTAVGGVVAIKTKKGRKTAIPFGPFLSIGAILYIFYGRELTSWYFGVLR
ncbi:MAG: A24 family peptidase [Pseudomonadota bacterium]